MPAEPDGRDWVLVVIKQGIVNYVYYDPAAGHTYPSAGPNAPGFSHVIVCSVEEQVTTTTEHDEHTSSTTTAARRPRAARPRATDHDDRPRPRLSTTTTTVDDTTTTTVDDTTTTTVGDTTTTGDPGTTSTIPDEVLPTVITSTTLGDEVLGTTIVPGELPFTGFADETLGRLALVIVVLGVLTLLVAKSDSVPGLTKRVDRKVTLPWSTLLDERKWNGGRRSVFSKAADRPPPPSRRIPRRHAQRQGRTDRLIEPY